MLCIHLVFQLCPGLHHRWLASSRALVLVRRGRGAPLALRNIWRHSHLAFLSLFNNWAAARRVPANCGERMKSPISAMSNLSLCENPIQLPASHATGHGLQPPSTWKQGGRPCHEEMRGNVCGQPLSKPHACHCPRFGHPDPSLNLAINFAPPSTLEVSKTLFPKCCDVIQQLVSTRHKGWRTRYPGIPLNNGKPKALKTAK